MDNEMIYKRMLCMAKAVMSQEIVCGFLEIDEDKNNWCMGVMVNQDGDYTYDIEDMYHTREYVEIEQSTIMFVSDM